MKEKNGKISIVTVICVFIIVLLITALIGIVLYSNQKNNNSAIYLNEEESMVQINNNSAISNDTKNEQITDIEYIAEKMNLSHAWVPYKAEDENGNEISLSNIWGTAIKYGGYLIFNKEDGTYSELIGVYENGKSLTGRYTCEGDTIHFYKNDGEKCTAKYIMYKDGEKIIKKQEVNNNYVYFRDYIDAEDLSYEELTEEEYKQDHYYFIFAKMEMNNDGTSTIYGALYKKEESPYYVVLVPGMYRKITVKNSTPLINDYPDIDTSNSVLGLYREDNEYAHEKFYITVYANSEIMLNFNFTNGECTEIETTNLPT